MKKIVSIACLFAGAALLAGCPKKNTTVEPPTAGSQVAGSANPNGEGASTSATPLGGDANAMGGAQGAAGPNAPAESRIIYFDFDKSDIKPEFAGIVTANAQYLTAIRAQSSSSRATPTSAARASTTSVSASGARRRCGGR